MRCKDHPTSTPKSPLPSFPHPNTKECLTQQFKLKGSPESQGGTEISSFLSFVISTSLTSVFCRSVPSRIVSVDYSGCPVPPLPPFFVVFSASPSSLLPRFHFCTICRLLYPTLLSFLFPPPFSLLPLKLRIRKRMKGRGQGLCAYSRRAEKDIGLSYLWGVRGWSHDRGPGSPRLTPPLPSEHLYSR